MARTKTVVLRLSEEEYNLLKELSGREPMNAYLRRVALAVPAKPSENMWAGEARLNAPVVGGVEGAQGIASGSRPSRVNDLAAERRDTDAPSPPEPQWKPAKPIPAEAFDWFKCPVNGCEFRARSSVARCPDHGRSVIMAR